MTKNKNILQVCKVFVVHIVQHIILIVQPNLQYISVMDIKIYLIERFTFSSYVKTGTGTLETAMPSTSISRQNRTIQIVKKLLSLGKFSCSSIYILDLLDRLEQTQKICLIKL